MKKLIFTFVALLTMATGVKAKTVETTLWNGTYTDGVELNSSTISTFAAGNVLRVYVTVPESGENFQIVYKGESNSWAETTIPSLATQWPWVNGGNTYYDITFTDADITALSGMNIYIYKGKNSTITKVSLISAVSPTSTTSVWNDTHDLDNWSGLQLTSSTYTDILSGAKKGDVLKVTYTSDESGNINICNSGYSSFTGGENSVSTTAVAATVEFEITTATILESIQTGGIVINGTNATLSAVDLLTYADSYDAVTVTIGSDGIATYSNGSKNIQVSACSGVRAYYASAVATGIVTLTELPGCIPANTGVIVQGDAGTYDIPVGSENWPTITTNYLKPTGGSSVTVVASTSSTYHYIFAKHNSEIGFYKLTTDHTLGAHKAYLETDNDITPTPTPTGARALIIFDDGQITSINSVQERKVENGIYYNLKGQRIQNPAKGLYIVNGKKVVVR